jgi:hypothetical protein
VEKSLMTRGFLYIAFGDTARSEALMSINSLKHFHAETVAVVSDSPIDGARFIPSKPVDRGARSIKVQLDQLTPFDYTVYLDADTRPRGDLSFLFDALEDGFDLVIAPSSKQDRDALWHVDAAEREATFDELGFTPVQLQAGVMAFSRSAAPFFAAWREEWTRFCGQDQAAFLRALQRVPVKLYVVGQVYNGGALVAHLHGRMKR